MSVEKYLVERKRPGVRDRFLGTNTHEWPLPRKLPEEIFRGVDTQKSRIWMERLRYLFESYQRQPGNGRCVPRYSIALSGPERRPFAPTRFM
jgi:hypothetical protein